MFKSGQPNPYDDIVNKTTDENLTGENWELILNLCDKVQEEGEQGARNVIAAVLKRLAHRNPNVQLYALSLAESLSKNCGIELHRELASRAFTQALEKIITDRTTHDKVKRRALALIALWAAEFESDPTLGIMEECYSNLKAKNFKFEAPQEAPPPTVDDEVRRREEEELQRVLAMSVQDKGGRGQWSGYSAAASSSGVGASSSNVSLGRKSSTSAAHQATSSSSHKPNTLVAPAYQSGYVPASTPSPKSQSPGFTHTRTSSVLAPVPAAAGAATPAPEVPAASQEPTPGAIPIVTRVRALHTFDPTEPGELAFEKGDVIKVVDRGYKDWWRGQFKGRTGIFPVNYVEPLPEPTAAELAKEAEQEAAVFAQAVNVDKLLTMLRGLDPAKDNLADNEEIQELYRSSMALRPKIVKLIDKYSQKRADLVSMNESFVKARTIFDRMMEDSLAMHSGFVYEQSRPNYRAQAASYQGRPDSRGRPDAGPQGYGWNPAVYDQPGYPAYTSPGPGYPQQGQPQPQYIDPNAYAQQQQAGFVQPYGPQPTSPYGGQQIQAQAGPQHMPQQQPFPAPGQQLPQQPQQIPQQAQIQPQNQPQSQQSPQPQQAPTQQPLQAQVQAQSAQSLQQQSGPPYVYDPNGTYPDPNVQAWAKYYAQGGKDLAGSVYFQSIPGLTDDSPQPAPQPAPQEHTESQQQHNRTQSQSQLHVNDQNTSPTSAQKGPEEHQQYTGPAQQPTEEAMAVGYATPPQAQQTYPDQSVAGPGTQVPVYAGAGPTSPTNGSQPPWAQSLPHGQPTSQPNSPNPQQQNFQPPASPTQSFKSGQLQSPHAGWHSQYNAMQNQMGVMDIAADGSGQHPGQQQAQHYQGVGASA